MEREFLGINLTENGPRLHNDTKAVKLWTKALDAVLMPYAATPVCQKGAVDRLLHEILYLPPLQHHIWRKIIVQLAAPYRLGAVLSTDTAVHNLAEHSAAVELLHTLLNAADYAGILQYQPQGSIPTPTPPSLSMAIAQQLQQSNFVRQLPALLTSAQQLLQDRSCLLSMTLPRAQQPSVKAAAAFMELQRRLLDIYNHMAKTWVPGPGRPSTLQGIYSSALPAGRLAVACLQAISTAMVRQQAAQAGPSSGATGLVLTCDRVWGQLSVCARCASKASCCSQSPAAAADEPPAYDGPSYAEIVADPCFLQCLFRCPLLAVHGTLYSKHSASSAQQHSTLHSSTAAATRKAYERMLQLLGYSEQTLNPGDVAMSRSMTTQTSEPVNAHQFQMLLVQNGMQQCMTEYSDYCAYMRQKEATEWLPQYSPSTPAAELHLLMAPLVLAWAAEMQAGGQVQMRDQTAALYLQQQATMCCCLGLDLWRCSDTPKLFPGAITPQLAADVVLASAPYLLDSLSRLLGCSPSTTPQVTASDQASSNGSAEAGASQAAEGPQLLFVCSNFMCCSSRSSGSSDDSSRGSSMQPSSIPKLGHAQAGDGCHEANSSSSGSGSNSNCNSCTTPSDRSTGSNLSVSAAYSGISQDSTSVDAVPLDQDVCLKQSVMKGLYSTLCCLIEATASVNGFGWAISRAADAAFRGAAVRTAAAWRKHAAQVTQVMESLLRTVTASHDAAVVYDPELPGVFCQLRYLSTRHFLQLLLEAAVASKSLDRQLQHCSLLSSLLKYSSCLGTCLDSPDNSCQYEGKYCMYETSAAAVATLAAKWSTQGAAHSSNPQHASLQALAARWCLAWAEDLSRYSQRVAIRAAAAAGAQCNSHTYSSSSSSGWRESDSSSSSSSSSSDGGGGRHRHVEEWHHELATDVHTVVGLLDACKGLIDSPNSSCCTPEHEHAGTVHQLSACTVGSLRLAWSQARSVFVAAQEQLLEADGGSKCEGVLMKDGELQHKLEALGVALSTAATPLLCNNPSCSNVSGPSELQLVSEGRSKICAGCCTARYCSRECQAAHWKHHKPVCRQLAAGVVE